MLATPIGLLLLQLLLLSVTWKGVSGYLRISSPSDLTAFATSVNGGSTFGGETVFLDADITLTGGFEPIGKTLDKSFKGTFDGQGHIITGLIVASTGQYAGLFGYSEGMVVKNVVLGNGCSIKDSYDTGDVFMGAILGECNSNGRCDIENTVSMATVTFDQTTNGTLYIGGIVGWFYSWASNYDSSIKNCANYGSVVKTGTSKSSYIGGIVGRSENPNSDTFKHITNCLNYGTITHSGEATEWLYMGGIAGGTKFTKIENCLSAGIVPSASVTNKFIGAIVGEVVSKTTITYCRFTGNGGTNVMYGGKTAPSDTTGSLTYSVGASAAVSALNSRVASNNDLNGWLLNNGGTAVTFIVNNNKGISCSSQVVLLPDMVGSDALKFSGWYDTRDCFSPSYDPEQVTQSKTFYGLYGSVVTVTFDANGGRVEKTSKVVLKGKDYGTLPEPTKTGHYFNGWYTTISGDWIVYETTGVSSANDHTLYAQWTPRKYTITFKSDGKTIQSGELDYGSTIAYPANQTKTGHTFTGWDKNVETVPDNDVTINAMFIINKYSISFMNDGKTIQSDELDYGSTIAYPANQTKTGHTFTGWDKDIETVPDNDVTINAMFVINKYTITLETNGGSACTPVVQDYGTKISLPTPEKPGHIFDYWCIDPELSTEYTESIMPAENLILYAKFTAIVSQYIIIFDFANGTTMESVLSSNETIAYPECITDKEGYAFGGWCPSPEFMPEENITVAALWIAKNYTITLDVNGGTELADIEIIITFDRTYGPLPTPVKSGHVFVGWFTEKNNGEEVKSDTVVSVASNHTIYAHWAEIATEQVEIVFGKKAMSEDEIKEFVDKYTDELFTIVAIEGENSDETRVIIRFSDVEKADEFFRAIKLSGESSKGFIHRIEFNSEEFDKSASPHSQPLLFFFLF